MSQMGKRGGLTLSDRNAACSRTTGRKGGRPKKHVAQCRPTLAATPHLVASKTVVRAARGFFCFLRDHCVATTAVIPQPQNYR